MRLPDMLDPDAGWSEQRRRRARCLDEVRAALRARYLLEADDTSDADDAGTDDDVPDGSLDDAASRVASVAAAVTLACDPAAGATGQAGLVADQVDTLVRASLEAAERTAATCVLAAAEADRRGLPGLDAHAGLRAWICRRYAVAGPDAGRLARQARFIGRHRPVGEALATGRIRMGHLACIVRTVPTDCEDLFDESWDWLADTAAAMHPDQFAIVMAAWRAHADQDRRPRDPVEDAQLRLWAGVDGLGHLDGTFDPEGFELLLAALEKHDRPDPTDGLLPPRTRNQRLAEQLVNIARFFLTHHQDPPNDDGDDEIDDGETRGDEPIDNDPTSEPADGPPQPAPPRSNATATINVFADIEALHPDLYDMLPLATRVRLRCELERFGPITPATAQRLTCNSYLARILTKGRSVVLDMGFRTDTFTDAQRRAIHAEFPTCPCGCDTPASWCDIHHIEPHDPANQRGPTDLHNGVPLCRRAHTLVHRRRRRLRKIAYGKVLFVPTE